MSRLVVSPAYARNAPVIQEVLEQVLPERGWVLELGSGPGQHACRFARRFAPVRWQPTEVSERLDAIRAWRAHEGLEEQVYEPLEVDLLEESWGLGVAGLGREAPVLIMSVNVIHIAPERAWRSMIDGASGLLEPGGLLMFYGPFRYASRELEPSNERFDQVLRSRGVGSGLRDAEEIMAYARGAGFELVEDRAVPANNRIIWFVKT